ncbi:hypothetical protein B0H17DRAFT_1197897 [Mycena rosella]|uniref:Uncharacterized protein n=1 Tax=Mycena rosella TaxID=1033263 RepID=A0AAD7GIW1_MYCRO|nr:hypothetical protein B0H17DRAFT_1197897 [Mycena rosella]
MPPQGSSRACRMIEYSNTSTSSWIVIPGAGDSLGHLVQYARVCSLHLVVIDTGVAKKALCPSDDVKEIKPPTGGKGAYAAVVTVTTDAGYKQAVAYLHASRMLMAVGLAGHAALDVSIIWWYS